MRTRATDWEAAAHSSIGDRLMRTGDFANAKVHFAKAVERTPDSPSASHNLGLAELRLTAYTPAAYYLRQALALAQEQADERQKLAARYNLAIVLRILGEHRSSTPARLGIVHEKGWNPEAEAQAVELARKVLSFGEGSVMRGTALLLAAGIIRRRSQKVTDATAVAALVAAERPEISVVIQALGVGRRPPTKDAAILLEQFVRSGVARKKLRVRYNRACYLAGLGADVSDGNLREPLWSEAIDELALALADVSLAQLAGSDPALSMMLSHSATAREVVERSGGDVPSATSLADLASLDAIGAEGAERLAAAGISDPMALVLQAGDKPSAHALGQSMGVSGEEVIRWASAARLVVVLGVAPEHANLLIAAGYGRLSRVARAGPHAVLGAMAEVNARRSFVESLPELWTVHTWIWRARTAVDSRHG